MTSAISGARSSSPISWRASYVIFPAQQDDLLPFHDLPDERIFRILPFPVLLLIERQIVDLPLQLFLQAYHHVVQLRDVHLTDHHKVDVAVLFFGALGIGT